MKKAQGFTLIELIIVIVVLGILAVTAAPQFINLSGDARGGTVNGVKASMQSVNTLINARAKANGLDNSETATISEDGATINLAFGYPRTTSADVSNWSNSLLEIDSDFTVANVTLDPTDGSFDASGSDAIVAYPSGTSAPAATDGGTCYAWVVNVSDGETSPAIVQGVGAVTSGC